MDVYWRAIAQLTYESVYPQFSQLVPWSSLSEGAQWYWVAVVKAAEKVLSKQ